MQSLLAKVVFPLLDEREDIWNTIWTFSCGMENYFYKRKHRKLSDVYRFQKLHKVKSETTKLKYYQCVEGWCCWKRSLTLHSIVESIGNPAWITADDSALRIPVKDVPDYEVVELEKWDGGIHLQEVL